MNAFNWINDLIQWCFKIVPRLTIVPCTRRAIIFGPKGIPVEKGPGLVFWWPLIHLFKMVAVTTQSMHIAARCVPAKNEEGIVPKVEIIGLAVQYKVVDALKAATAVLDISRLVDNRCKAAVDSTYNSESILNNLAGLESEFGVRVFRADITHSGQVVGLINFNADYAWEDKELESNHE